MRRIGEKQHGDGFATGFDICRNQAGHAVGLCQRVIRRGVKRPVFSKIAAYGYRPPVPLIFYRTVEVIAHVQHNASVTQFNGLRLGSVRFGAFANFPGFSLVGAVNNGRLAGVLPAIQGLDAQIGFVLSRKYQRSVTERESSPRPGQEQLPGRVFNLGGDINGITPADSVVGALCQDKLPGFFGRHSGF